MQKTRKLIAMLLAVLTLLSMSTVGLFSVSALPENAIVNGTEGNDASGINGEVLGLMGDADGSEKINVKDATQIQKHAAKLIQLDEASMTLADVDLNDKVNVKDATAIQKWVAKIAVDASINCLVYIPATETEPTTTASVPATVVVVPETTSTADEPTTATTGDEPVVTVPVIKPTFVTEPTEATTKATEPTEATTKATEATEPTEATTKATEATTKATEPTENTTEETIVTEPTEETIVTEATIGAGYYLVGKIDGQTLEDADSLTADRKLSENGSDYVLYWTTVGGDEYKVAYFDGTSITKLFKAEGEPYYKIGETSDKIGFCKVEFNPDGKSSWSYTYMTVNVTDDNPTSDPSGVTEGYYLVGTLNGQNCWSADSLTADRKLTKSGSDYILNWTFYGGDELKVVYYDGTAIKTWYKPDDADNYKIGAESDKVGAGTLTFNPDGKDTWSYYYFTVKAGSTPVDPSDPTPSDPSGLTEGYYLVGTLNGQSLWSADKLTADRKLTKSGNDYFLNWTFVGGDELKVVYFDGTAIKTWYKPDGADNYKIGAESDKVGAGTLTFNPDGKDTWTYYYFTVKADSTPDDPSDPTPSDPSGLTEGYYLVGTLNGQDCWSADSLTADRKLTKSGDDYTLSWTFYGGDEIKVVYYDGTEIKTWYKPDGADNYIIGAESDKVGAGTLTFNPDGKDTWTYYYFTVKADSTPDDPSDPTPSDPSGLTEGYYLVGTLNGQDCWSADSLTADRKLTKSGDDYVLSWTFYGGDEIKVVYYDGTAIKTWYKPDGADNYIIGAESDKVGAGTLTFNPDGKDTWTYYYFTVKADSTPVDPSDPTPSDPSGLTEGYYLVGTLNGQDCWSADSLTADRKLTKSGDDYTLSWTFYGGDEIKVVYYDGTAIKTWYKDGDAANYIIGAESDKVGAGTLTFNPDGKDTWTYYYFTVKADSTPVDPSDPTPSDPSGLTEGYYLVGTLNGQDCWSADSLTADRKLTKSGDNYTLNWTFYGGDEIKVVYYDGTAIKTWYNDGGDNYVISVGSGKEGDRTLTFNPDGGMGSYNYFTVK